MTTIAEGNTYSDDFVQQVLGSVKTIAMVGASANPDKASHDVLKFMIAAGYDMIPVNPRPDLTEIEGLAVYPSLKAIDRPVDMVEVFRPSLELAGFAREAVDIGAKVFWAQLGIHDAEAKRIAEQGGLKVVMDRCPKIELTARAKSSL